MMRRDPGAELARAIAFTEAIVLRCSTKIESFRWGRALLAPEVDQIWDRNYLLVEEPDGHITASALAEEAERVMAPLGYKHRKVVVNDEPVGVELASGFTELGWESERLLWMVHRRASERTSDIAVDELVESVYLSAKDEFNRRNPDIADDEVIRQMREAARTLGEATDRRCFGAYVGDTVAAVCELYSDGLTAQVEDVGTLEEFRRGGLASAVVLRALHEARSWGHNLVFLCADEDDWPKELYSKLGFDAVGRTYRFLLKPTEMQRRGADT